MEQLTWRRRAADDEPLLFALFVETKAREFAPLGLSAQQLQPLLEMQYRARQQSYALSYPAAVDMILCLEDGRAIGRHLVERQSNCYRCIDLAILPECRNQGIGTWALRQLQRLAALESVPLRLSVTTANPALHLYERLGFIRASSDALAYEMEWHAPRVQQPGFPQESKNDLAQPAESAANRQDVLDRIFAFLREIGLRVELGIVPSTAFLPGIQMVREGLRVDPEALLYPGDLLHEAGHLAVMTPERRAEEFPNSNEPAEEMGAMAWSYAAAVHVGVPPEVVFHENGYRGHGRILLQGFEAGNRIGLPFLWWIGLTTPDLPGEPSIYPRMLRWLRGGEEESTTPQEDRLQIRESTASPRG